MQNAQDGTIIVPNEELQLIIKANNLPDDLGAKIQEHFSGPFSQLAEWQAKADSIVITSEDQVEQIALANDGRKTLMKIRTSIEKVRKELKDPYFRMGQTIDSVAKALTAKIEPIEADLKAKSDFAVNLAAERRNRLVAERKLALQEVGHSGDIPGIGEMSDETFEMVLGGAKEKARLQREATEREAADREAAELEAKAEAERIANAEKVLNDRILRLVEAGAKRGNDPVPYLKLGELAMSLESLGELQDESFDLLVEEFKAEQDCINAEAQAKLDRKDRFDSRVRALLSLGAKEIKDGENDRIELGNSKVMLDALYDLNESDERWDFTLTSFQDESQRIADERAEQVKIKQRLAERVKSLLSIGAKEYRDNDIVGYRLGDVTITEHHVYDATPESWSDAFVRFEKEAQRLAKIEEEKLQAQQERLQTANDRLAKLRNVEFNALFVDVADLTDVEFDALLKVKTNEHNAAKERQRITNLGLMRKPLLDAQGEIRSAEFLGGLTDDEFQSMLDNAVRLKANADQQRANEAAQAAIETQRKVDEAQRLKDEENARKKAESATDKEKLEEMVKQIQAIVMPTCSSIQGDAIARGAIERLGKLVGHMHEAMNNM